MTRVVYWNNIPMSVRVETTRRPVRVMLFAAAPMYYQAPLYRRLAEDDRVEFEAVFASSAGVRLHDAGYGKPIAWDIDVLQGYRSRFLNRASRNPLGGGSFWSLRDWDVISLIREARPDVLWLHGYNALTNVLAAVTQRSIGGVVMFREEQTLLHRRALWRRLVKQVALPILFHNACGLYIGTENRRWFESFRVPTERLFFTPYCVDGERLKTQAIPSSDELRGSFGIRPGLPVILTVTRLIPRKQPLALLEAFARLRAERPCALLVVGSGVLETEMRERASQIPDVVLAGFLNQREVAHAYGCADIFALFSRENETWGLAVNEAMHFGLPVVVSDMVGCATDLVRDGENGFRVGVDDVAGLASRLGVLVDQEELRRSFGAASFARIAEWNYERAAEGVVAAACTLARNEVMA